jgi:hypothetical protein
MSAWPTPNLRRPAPARSATEAKGLLIIHFPEGATCSPHKRIMSVTGPAEYDPHLVTDDRSEDRSAF